MSAVITTPTDVVNLALVRIGFKQRIGDIFDGSPAAQLSLTIYSQTRDALLRGGEWPWAERNVLMTLLKSAPPGGYFPPTQWSPAYPSPPWAFQYAWPDDCLRVRAIKPAPLFVQNLDPRPVVFSVENDNATTPSIKVILCNVPYAVLTYTGQVTEPQDWDVDFVEAVAAAIGRRLAPALVGLNATQLAAQDEAVSKAMAEMEAADE